MRIHTAPCGCHKDTKVRMREAGPRQCAQCLGGGGHPSAASWGVVARAGGRGRGPTPPPATITPTALLRGMSSPSSPHLVPGWHGRNVACPPWGPQGARQSSPRSRHRAVRGYFRARSRQRLGEGMSQDAECPPPSPAGRLSFRGEEGQGQAIGAGESLRAAWACGSVRRRESRILLAGVISPSTDLTKLLAELPARVGAGKCEPVARGPRGCPGPAGDAGPGPAAAQGSH